MKLTRDSFTDSTLDELVLDILESQLEDVIELSNDQKLIEAFKYVIAYNSVPGTYEDGKYDL
jgi:hypothetical protein